MPILHGFSSFEGTSYKNLWDTANSSLTSCFAVAFTSHQISFFTTSFRTSTLSEKNFFFPHKFFFNFECTHSNRHAP